MWKCHHCGESDLPEKHTCNTRVLKAVEYGRELGRNEMRHEMEARS